MVCSKMQAISIKNFQLLTKSLPNLSHLILFFCDNIIDIVLIENLKDFPTEVCEQLNITL